MRNTAGSFALGQPFPSFDCVEALEDIFVYRQDAPRVSVSFLISVIPEQIHIDRVLYILAPREFVQSLLVTPLVQSHTQLPSIPWEDWTPHARMFLYGPLHTPHLDCFALLASKYLIGPSRNS